MVSAINTLPVVSANSMVGKTIVALVGGPPSPSIAAVVALLALPVPVPAAVDMILVAAEINFTL